MKTPIAILSLVSFLVNLVIGPMPSYAQDYHLPVPGVMVHLSPESNPPILKGIKVHPDNPFRFDFILDKGDSKLNNNQLKDESSKLIKYFLASLTIPEKDLWVNLSPYEKDRIIPNSFGLTEMGRDLLAEDYMLKQITASLIYPEDTIGRKFWKRIYEEASKKYGTTNIPVNTFNKVWIVPQKAVVYENARAGTAYVVESKLKVMLEQDYLSLAKHEGSNAPVQSKETSQLGSDIVREIVIPELTKEVNEDKNFSRLRQVYNSLILATWYKKKIKDSILEQVYENKNKVAGVSIDDPQEKERIYQKYLSAFKKGVFNYIKEDVDLTTQETVPRKYFSGGMAFNAAMTTAIEYTKQVPSDAGNDEVIESRFNRATVVNNKAMIVSFKRYLRAALSIVRLVDSNEVRDLKALLADNKSETIAQIGPKAVKPLLSILNKLWQNKYEEQRKAIREAIVRIGPPALPVLTDIINRQYIPNSFDFFEMLSKICKQANIDQVMPLTKPLVKLVIDGYAYQGIAEILAQVKALPLLLDEFQKIKGAGKNAERKRSHLIKVIGKVIVNSGGTSEEISKGMDIVIKGLEAAPSSNSFYNSVEAIKEIAQHRQDPKLASAVKPLLLGSMNSEGYIKRNALDALEAVAPRVSDEEISPAISPLIRSFNEVVSAPQHSDESSQTIAAYGSVLAVVIPRISDTHTITGLAQRCIEVLQENKIIADFLNGATDQYLSYDAVVPIEKVLIESIKKSAPHEFTEIIQKLFVILKESGIRSGSLYLDQVFQGIADRIPNDKADELGKMILEAATAQDMYLSINIINILGVLSTKLSETTKLKALAFITHQDFTNHSNSLDKHFQIISVLSGISYVGFRDDIDFLSTTTSDFHEADKRIERLLSHSGPTSFKLTAAIILGLAARNKSLGYTLIRSLLASSLNSNEIMRQILIDLSSQGDIVPVVAFVETVDNSYLASLLSMHPLFAQNIHRLPHDTIRQIILNPQLRAQGNEIAARISEEAGFKNARIGESTLFRYWILHPTIGLEKCFQILEYLAGFSEASSPLFLAETFDWISAHPDRMNEFSVPGSEAWFLKMKYRTLPVDLTQQLGFIDDWILNGMRPLSDEEEMSLIDTLYYLSRDYRVDRLKWGKVLRKNLERFVGMPRSLPFVIYTLTVLGINLISKQEVAKVLDTAARASGIDFQSNWLIQQALQNINIDSDTAVKQNNFLHDIIMQNLDRNKLITLLGPEFGAALWDHLSTNIISKINTRGGVAPMVPPVIADDAGKKSGVVLLRFVSPEGNVIPNYLLKGHEIEASTFRGEGQAFLGVTLGKARGYGNDDGVLVWINPSGNNGRVKTQQADPGARAIYGDELVIKTSLARDELRVYFMLSDLVERDGIREALEAEERSGRGVAYLTQQTNGAWLYSLDNKVYKANDPRLVDILERHKDMDAKRLVVLLQKGDKGSKQTILDLMDAKGSVFRKAGTEATKEQIDHFTIGAHLDDYLNAHPEFLQAYFEQRKISREPVEVVEDTRLGSQEANVIMINGRKYYAKFYEEEDRMRMEYLSWVLAKQWGLKVCDDMRLVRIDGRLAIASSWIEGSTAKTARPMSNNDLAREYVFGSFIQDRDRGKDDNYVKGPDGSTYIIDMGGAGPYRSTGGIKGEGREAGQALPFGVDNFTNMLSDGSQQRNKPFYRTLRGEQGDRLIQRAMREMAAEMTPEFITAIVQAMGFQSPEIAQKIQSTLVSALSFMRYINVGGRFAIDDMGYESSSGTLRAALSSTNEGVDIRNVIMSTVRQISPLAQIADMPSGRSGLRSGNKVNLGEHTGDVLESLDFDPLKDPKFSVLGQGANLPVVMRLAAIFHDMGKFTPSAYGKLRAEIAKMIPESLQSELAKLDGHVASGTIINHEELSRDLLRLLGGRVGGNALEIKLADAVIALDKIGWMSQGARDNHWVNKSPEFIVGELLKFVRPLLNDFRGLNEWQLLGLLSRMSEILYIADTSISEGISAQVLTKENGHYRIREETMPTWGAVKAVIRQRASMAMTSNSGLDRTPMVQLGQSPHQAMTPTMNILSVDQLADQTSLNKKQREALEMINLQINGPNNRPGGARAQLYYDKQWGVVVADDISFNSYVKRSFDTTNDDDIRGFHQEGVLVVPQRVVKGAREGNKRDLYTIEHEKLHEEYYKRHGKKKNIEQDMLDEFIAVFAADLKVYGKIFFHDFEQLFGPHYLGNKAIDSEERKLLEGKIVLAACIVYDLLINEGVDRKTYIEYLQQATTLDEIIATYSSYKGAEAFLEYYRKNYKLSVSISQIITEEKFNVLSSQYLKYKKRNRVAVLLHQANRVAKSFVTQSRRILAIGAKGKPAEQVSLTQKQTDDLERINQRYNGLHNIPGGPRAYLYYDTHFGVVVVDDESFEYYVKKMYGSNGKGVRGYNDEGVSVVPETAAKGARDGKKDDINTIEHEKLHGEYYALHGKKMNAEQYMLDELTVIYVANLKVFGKLNFGDFEALFGPLYLETRSTNNEERELLRGKIVLAAAIVYDALMNNRKNNKMYIGYLQQATTLDEIIATYSSYEEAEAFLEYYRGHYKISVSISQMITRERFRDLKSQYFKYMKKHTLVALLSHTNRVKSHVMQGGRFLVAGVQENSTLKELAVKLSNRILGIQDVSTARLDSSIGLIPDELARSLIPPGPDEMGDYNLVEVINWEESKKRITLKNDIVSSAEGSAHQAMNAASLGEMGKENSLAKRGGIDLTPAKGVLETQNAGEEIKFHLNQAQLAQLQNAPGFVPVIINIQPLKNLQEFLGVNEPAQTSTA